MWHTIKHTNKCIIGVQEVEEEEKGAEKIQIKTKNFWNILKHNNLHIWKALQTVYDKCKKVHDKTHHSKCADCQRHRKYGNQQEKKNDSSLIREPPIRLTAVFSSETMEAIRKWVNMFKVLKDI